MKKINFATEVAVWDWVCEDGSFEPYQVEEKINNKIRARRLGTKRELIDFEIDRRLPSLNKIDTNFLLTCTYEPEEELDEGQKNFLNMYLLKGKLTLRSTNDGLFAIKQ